METLLGNLRLYQHVVQHMGQEGFSITLSWSGFYVSDVVLRNSYFFRILPFLLSGLLANCTELQMEHNGAG